MTRLANDKATRSAAQTIAADEPAIARMAARLIGEVSVADGVLHLAGRDEAQMLVRDLLQAAAPGAEALG